MKRLLKFVLLIFIVLYNYKVYSKEVGDLRYKIGSQTWGHKDGSYNFPSVVGHVCIYIGTDEEEKDWYIEGVRTKVQIRKNEPSDLDNDFYHYNFTKTQRKDAIVFCKDKVDADYVNIFSLPGVDEQKGSGGRWTCVGLVESAYEDAGINITPDGEGRNLVDSGDALYDTWNEKEGSKVGIGPFNIIKGWVFFPYTQWYEQTHKDHLPVDDSMRMIISTASNPNVSFDNLSSGDIIYGKHSIKVNADDGSEGSGIFKVELYHTSINESNLLTNHDLSYSLSGLNTITELEHLKRAQLYTYGDPDGSPMPKEEELPSGSGTYYKIFYYKEDAVPIELTTGDKYKFEWNTKQANISTANAAEDAKCPEIGDDYGPKYPDKKYKIFAKATDRAGHTKDVSVSDVIVDNFRPFVRFNTL